MDLLESGDERERRPLGPRLRSALTGRPPGWGVVAVAVLVVGTLGAGLAARVQVADVVAREAARVEVDLRVVGTPSSTVGGVARGDIELLLVNRRDRRVDLEELRVEVQGLRVLRTEPEFVGSLGESEERVFRIAFRVDSCDELVLPGRLLVSLIGNGQAPQRRELPVSDPDDGGNGSGGVVLAACPDSARGEDAGTATDIGVRPAGGASRRVGAGAEGSLRLEVRNGGTPARLVAVDARVPGVVFVPRLLQGGRSLQTDGLVLVRLAFRIEDCARLKPHGWVVLRVERFGAIQELGLRISAEPAAGLGPQVQLPVVLSSCD